MPGRVQLVILDDDPTGVQTVHGCLLFTRWDPETLRAGFRHEQPFFYVLTNTRAREPEAARRITEEIVANVLALNREFGHQLLFMSRSDSTLRSHFPIEINAVVEAVEEELGRVLDAVFLVPAFFEGGRLTAGDVHYVLDDDRRVPASDTEYARDSVFGYSTSHLPSYIEEKTGGAVPAEEVLSVSLRLLRTDERGELRQFLDDLSDRRYVVVNAESYADLERFAEGVLRVVEQGKRFAFQSAASVVKALARVPDKPLLDGGIARDRGAGLFIVGSHVQKTTRQLNRLLESTNVGGIELDVEAILARSGALQVDAQDNIESVMADGVTPVVYTSREELRFDSKRERLAAGQRISEFLAAIVRSLADPPAYLVAKGGITAHDVLVQGLEIDSAVVLGQTLPGVPTIAAPEGNRFRGMPYVIFPGNVGGDEALLEVYRKFEQETEGRR
ncbi:MAG: four-carbon acid sugar kinase family protein [Candidatus Brocadiaceae bacterium]|jgi:uncharacterized protein YgbK (DUF1537 family)